MNWKLFSRRPKENSEAWNIRTMFGPNLNFATTEAYKLLRTNVMFSFTDDGDGHVIGISSSVQAEGKSSTACNLAYMLAESGSRTVLVEADLRKPTLGQKLNIPRVPGISNLLVSRMDYKTVVQHCALAPNLGIITSGEIPPNPSELLASVRMEELIKQLKQDYDYIVMDLPPVNVVSDTLAVSKCLDGIVMVVRSCLSDQHMLSEAMRQLEMVNVRVLGFVYRNTDAVSKRYGKNYGKYYGKRYYKYYRKYSHEYGKK